MFISVLHNNNFVFVRKNLRDTYSERQCLRKPGEYDELKNSRIMNYRLSPWSHTHTLYSALMAVVHISETNHKEDVKQNI